MAITSRDLTQIPPPKPEAPGDTWPRVLPDGPQPPWRVETRSYGGAGIGLAVVRGVARGHGGYVSTRTPAEETMADVSFSGAGFTLVIAQRAHTPAS